ncbi:arginine/serine-rich coiled-coil protein 2 isoform X2 [Carica papaya]|uniref:arginine/serine-rich coiled-coil protein 2 isoform X2 n=1 Tax=Carica papaya TaxID=3649 RepID=UPI000B8C7298|nr:arginine/serine-rich coiled-coil protein 2 isoform X2 [Carica papaya]
MDANPQSPSSVNVDPKATFRKPSNDAASRKYRRRSPASRSSSSDGSPKNHQSPSPLYSRENPPYVSEHQQRRKDDERELNKDSSRSQIGKTSDSYRHSDHHSSRSSQSHSKRDDYGRRDKHVDDEDRNYQKSSSRSARESMSSHHSDYTRQESEYGRSKGYMDRYQRDKYDDSGNRSKDKEKETSSFEHQKHKDKDHSSDRAGSGRRHANTKSEETEREWHARERDSRDERRDYHRSSGDRRSDRTYSRDEPRGHRHDSTSRRDDSGHHAKEGYKSDPKDEKRKYDDWETKRDKDRYSKVPGERFEDKTVFASESQESPAKKPKSSSSDKFFDSATDGSKFSMTVVEDKQFSTSKESTSAQEIDGKSLVGQSQANYSGFANDLDAAKVAAMRAAELVNKNLVGGGYMTTDQKKKLLWGNKKATTTEESAHRWDNALFSDRERQEKFNKLMGVKGDASVEQKSDKQDPSGLLRAEKQKELQLDLEKQYTAGLRRRDGRTVGLGL